MGRDKLIAARAGRSVPAQTMAGDTAAELASGTDRMLLRLDNFGKSFGGNSAMTDISLTPSEGQFSGQSAGGSASLCCPVWSLPLAGPFLGRGIREWTWRRPGKAEFATLVAVGRSATSRRTPRSDKIEHRLFSQITLNWRGRPLTTHQVIVDLIATTSTSTVL